MKFEFSSSEFAYEISENPTELFGCCEMAGNYAISHTKNTDVKIFGGGGISSDDFTVIIGLCVDSNGELNIEDILHRINALEGFQQTHQFIKRLAGKFIVMKQQGGTAWLFPDATASLPIFYHNRKTLMISSIDNIVRRELNLDISDTSKEVRESGSYGQPYPYDMAISDDIKCVLPDSVLDIRNLKVTRLVSRVEPILDREDVDAEILKTGQMIRNITRAYAEKYEMILPLTAGRDSRLVFSFLKSCHIPFESYTYKGNEGTEIPERICGDENVKHQLIDVESCEKEFQQELKKIIGPFHTQTMFNYGYTVAKRFSGKAILNGDIIDQIGESLIGKKLSGRFATTDYFMAKIHNYSKACREQLVKWKSEIERIVGKDNLYDYFAIDSRMARWSTLYSMTYSICGVPSLNIFNCGDVIDTWRKVPRKLRAENYINQILMEENWKRLSKYPVNPNDKMKFVDKSSMLFLIATYTKYILGKPKH